MSSFRRHLRALGVAFATLALSAGVAFAGGGLVMPDAAADGLARAAEAAGKIVPVGNVPEVDEPVVDEPVVDEPAEEEPAEEEPADDDSCPPADEDAVHGAIVCAAAHADVPEGYANRGEYVSEIARQNHGAEVAAEKAANGGRPDAATKGLEKARGAKPADAGRP